MSDRKLFTPEEVEAESKRVKDWTMRRILIWMDLLDDERRLEVMSKYCPGCGTIQSMYPQGSCNCQRDE